MPHHRETAPRRPLRQPHLELDGRGPDWILESSGGTRWKIYNCRPVDGHARRADQTDVQFRVFESPDGRLRRYILDPRERRDMIASLVDRQLQRSHAMERRADEPAPAPKGWERFNDGWDAYREHHGWGPPEP